MPKLVHHTIIVVILLSIQGCATYRIPPARQAEVAGRVWVITGASSGLGRGIALEAGRYGAKVVLAARNESELEEVARKIRQSGGQALVVPTDVSDTAGVKQLMAATLSTWGQVDVWVNNAGVTVFGVFSQTPLSHQGRVIDVNLKGTLYGSYVALQQFSKQGYGKVINISSAESRIPTAYQASYAASKAAIQNMGIVIRQELRLANQKHITLVAVDPWAMNTPIWDHAANYTGHAPRMGLMDRTQKAVNAVMHAATGPRNRDLAVGWKTHTAYVVHDIWPRLAYRIASNTVHKHQMEQGPEAADSPGNLYSPSDKAAVETDIKDRIKREKKARKRR